MAVKPQRAHPLSLLRVPLDWTLPAERALLLVRDDPHPFGLIGRWAGGGALIGSSPVRVASAEEDPFDLLDDQPTILAPTGDGPLADKTLGAVGGGWFGWLGYQLGRRLEPIDAGPPPVPDDPPFHLAFYDHLLRLDPSGRWWFEALWSPERATALSRRLAELRGRAAESPGLRDFSTEPWRATPGVRGHALAVAACRERIRAGDLFQANICTRLESALDGEPIDLFVAALMHLRPDRAAFVSTHWGAVASLSPELFLERRGRRIRSAPIKGTRAKPTDVLRAMRARDELIRSPKDRAENVMIVDLVRNDLGRVCVPGSIHVDALAHARAHAGVWHLISEVSGELRDGVGDGETVRAAFPPGSVSGAPKIAAMNVIAELESTARELYTGSIGFASPLAGLELSVAIRTFEFRGRLAWLGVGGGIVADSDPDAEAAECMTKATPLLAAIGARLAGSPPRAHRPGIARPPPRLGPRPLPRPEPSAGVFETLLVMDGLPVGLADHLRRIGTSVATLYGSDLPAGVENELLDAAWRLEVGRLRLDVRPDVQTPSGQTVRSDIAVSPLPMRDTPIILHPTTVPGGLGHHKWIDRRLVGALGGQVGGEPLLCDLDGLVLEAGRANVFAVEPGGRLATPPVDGRILPGVTRGRVIRLARALALDVQEEPIELARLAAAEEVFLTGSLRGVEAAVLEAPGPADERTVGDALGSPAGDSVTARLADAWAQWARGTAAGLTLNPEPAPLPA